MPDGLSIKTLKENHPSIPRNRLIAKVFFYAGLIEQWGSGIEKMVRESVNAGLPEPTFEETVGFRVTFHKATSQSTQQVPDKYPTSKAPDK